MLAELPRGRPALPGRAARPASMLTAVWGPGPAAIPRPVPALAPGANGAVPVLAVAPVVGHASQARANRALARGSAARWPPRGAVAAAR